jgi:hypothetical protein
MIPTFCSPWDEALARRGPPSVFLPDREGLLRFDADWTRDCWGRAPGPHADGWSWLLVRDRDTGFVNLLLATSPTLIAEHPRADVRAHDTAEGAYAAWRAPW